jgi:hypothetical protein
MRRAKSVPVPQDDINSMATGLPRIVTEFRGNRLSFPSTIQLLAAPLCPRNSMIYMFYCNTSHGIRLKGLSYLNWYDRISCIPYRDRTTKSIACQDQWFAVGLSNGMKYIYCRELHAALAIHAFAIITNTKTMGIRRIPSLLALGKDQQPSAMRLSRLF